jgi:hypothetical protein
MDFFLKLTLYIITTKLLYWLLTQILAKTLTKDSWLRFRLAEALPKQTNFINKSSINWFNQPIHCVFKFALSRRIE